MAEIHVRCAANSANAIVAWWWRWPGVARWVGVATRLRSNQLALLSPPSGSGRVFRWIQCFNVMNWWVIRGRARPHLATAEWGQCENCTTPRLTPAPSCSPRWFTWISGISPTPYSLIGTMEASTLTPSGFRSVSRLTPIQSHYLNIVGQSMWAIESISISLSSGRMMNKESGLKSIYFYVCRYCFTFIFK